MFSTALAGFGFGLGLIVAIGAQNAFVLRQGLKREHVGVVVAICALSDVVLITIGAAGVGRFVASQATLLTIVTIAGAGVLLWYGWSALKRVIRPEALHAQMDDGAAPLGASGTTASLASPTGTGAPGAPAPVATATRPAKVSSAVVNHSLRAAVLTALALTWLNPHVYLDTVVLLGSVSANYPQPWIFALGAAVASIAWFSALGFGARWLAPLFAKPMAWRIFDGVIALIMAAIAAKLLLGLA